MRLGFTGSRHGCTPEQLLSLGRLLRVFYGRAEGIAEAHHGAALGADLEFARLAAEFMVPARVGHPSDLRKWTSPEALSLCTRTHPPLPPLERNARIVAASDVLLACPKSPTWARSGTWGTVQRARRRGVPVWLVLPSGEVVKEAGLP